VYMPVYVYVYVTACPCVSVHVCIWYQAHKFVVAAVRSAELHHHTLEKELSNLRHLGVDDGDQTLCVC
jgi:hypothetical protein